MHFFFKLNLLKKKSPSPQLCVCVAYLPHGYLGLRKIEKQGRQEVIFCGQSSTGAARASSPAAAARSYPWAPAVPSLCLWSGPSGPRCRALHGPSCALVSCPWPVRSGPAASLPDPPPSRSAAVGTCCPLRPWCCQDKTKARIMTLETKILHSSKIMGVVLHTTCMKEKLGLFLIYTHIYNISVSLF